MDVHRPIIRRLLTAPGRVCVVDDQRAWKSYQLYIGALHVARAIAGTTDAPHVGVMLPTSGLFPMAALAGWMLGRTVVPFNYLLKGEDLAYVIDDAEVDSVVTVGPMVEFVGGLPDAVRQIRLDEMSFGGFPPLRRAKPASSDDLAVLLYTSGTSGRPKGVMLTHGNIASNIRQSIAWAGFTTADVVFGVLPQFHSFGLTVLTMLPLTVGCKVVFTAKFVPRRIITLMATHGATALVAIPSMYNALLGVKKAGREDFRTLRYVVSGGEPLPKAVSDGFRERFGIEMSEGYGLTETGPVTNWCRPQDGKPGSVGRPLPDVEEKIVDPAGRRLGPNEDGEICMKGPNVMAGYYKLPEQTAAVFDEEGFFRSGDMGRFDDDGFLYITGRIKEMLIIAGENVFPREIEEVLNAHPSVHDSAVVGRMDESRGEVPHAFVELSDGATFDETALRTHCREFLAPYKVPREIQVLEALPRNATGKIMRRELPSS